MGKEEKDTICSKVKLTKEKGFMALVLILTIAFLFYFGYRAVKKKV